MLKPRAGSAAAGGIGSGGEETWTAFLQLKSETRRTPARMPQVFTEYLIALISYFTRRIITLQTQHQDMHLSFSSAKVSIDFTRTSHFREASHSPIEWHGKAAVL
jgi:hypothetical protein